MIGNVSGNVSGNGNGNGIMHMNSNLSLFSRKENLERSHDAERFKSLISEYIQTDAGVNTSGIFNDKNSNNIPIK